MSDMREKYESLALNDLKEIAKVRGIRISGLKKAELIEAMLEEDKKDEEKGKVVGLAREGGGARGEGNRVEGSPRSGREG